MTESHARYLSTLLLAGCVAILAGTASLLVAPSLRPVADSNSQHPEGYSVGTVVDLPTDLYASRPFTIIVFAQSSCGVCQRSKSLLAEIVSDFADQSSVGVTMITSTEAPLLEEQTFAREIGLSESSVKAFLLSNLRLRGVPTVLAVDRDGSILMVREGAPQESDRQDLKRTLGASTLAALQRLQ